LVKVFANYRSGKSCGKMQHGWAGFETTPALQKTYRLPPTINFFMGNYSCKPKSEAKHLNNKVLYYILI
jgi:hypothetical protein